MMNNLRKNNGVILVTVLWIIMILSLIAWGLGRRSSMEVSLLETYQGQMRSYAAARGGLNVLLNMMEKGVSDKDSLYLSGVVIDDKKEPKDVFEHIEIGPQAYATIQWNGQGFFKDGKKHWEFGIQNEQGKIDLNALNPTNYLILAALFQQKGMPQSQAEALALAIVNYRQNPNNTQTSLDQKQMKPKGQPYEHLAELLEINGMTREFFDKVKGDLTVFSDAPEAGTWISVNAASNDMLEALANYTVNHYNAQMDHDQLLRQAYEMRDGKDGQPFTHDDGGTGGNFPPYLRDGKSSFYHAHIIGVDEKSGARSSIDAVIFRPANGAPQIKGWQRE